MFSLRYDKDYTYIKYTIALITQSINNVNEAQLEYLLTNTYAHQHLLRDGLIEYLPHTVDMLAYGRCCYRAIVQ